MTLAPPAWRRERHGRMEAARSLLRASPSPVGSPQQVNRRRNRELLDLSGHNSNNSNSDTPTAIWASPSAARVRPRPSNLHSAVRASPSFALSRREAAATPLRMPVERVARATVQSRTTQATQTDAAGVEETDVELTSVDGLHLGAGIHLGAFGDVGEMTAETVDFLIRVLEDRKQELLVNGEDRGIHVRASYAVAEDEDDASEEGQTSPASEVARLQLDSTTNGGVGVTELVRSHSYEALVQLEGILEARHHSLMNDGLLKTADDSS